MSRIKIEASEKRTSFKKIVNNFPQSEVKTFCEDLKGDFSELKDILNNKKSSHRSNMLPYLLDNYRIVRYEDIAANSEQWTISMYEFLQIPLDVKVLTWIKENTNLDATGKQKYFSFLNFILLSYGVS